MGISSFMALWSTGTITNGVFVSKSDEYIFASNERTSVPFFFGKSGVGKSISLFFS